MVEISNATGIPSVNPEIAAPDQQLEVDPKAAAAGQQLGAAVTGVGKFFGQLQTTDVMNKADTQAQGLMAHYATLQGQDALNAAPIVQKQISDIYTQARGQLGSFEQQATFDQGMSENIRTYGREIASQAHDGSIEYARATIQASSDNADNNANRAGTIQNPDVSDASFQAALKASVQAGVRGNQIEGNEHDPNVVMDTANQNRSRTTSAYIMSRANLNPQLGMDVYNKYKSYLNPQDQQKMLSYVHEKAMPQMAQTVAQQVIAGGGAPVMQVSDTQWNAQVSAESNGQQLGPDGKPLTSSAGAVGKAQLMQATAEATAKAHGIAWSQNEFETNSAYNENLGRLTMNDLLGEYHGNYNVALAAYNAGPNNTGVLHYAQTGDPSMLPAATQAYIGQITAGNDDMQYQIAQATAIMQAKMPDDPEGAAQAAYSAVYRIRYQNDAVTRNAQEAQRTASNNFAASIMNTINQSHDKGTPLPANLVDTIDNAPNVDWQTKDTLRKAALSATGQDQIAGYGPGYTNTMNLIVAPYGTKGKITSASQIIALQNSNQLSVSGAHELIGALNAEKSPATQGITTMKAGLLTYMRSKLTFDGDNDIPGMPPMKDPAGAAIYDTKAIPMFEASFNKWVADGKDPMAYPVDQLDKMVTQLRPQSQFDAARIAAEGGTPPGQPDAAANPQTPVPPAPPTVKSPSAWSNVMANPPVLQNGQFPMSNWNAAITHLMADPSKQTIAQFDQTFGPYGYNGEELVAQLSTVPSQPNPAVPQPVMP